MNTAELILFIIMLIIVAEYFLESWLSWLNISTYRESVPGILQRILTYQQYITSRDYQKEHYNLSSWIRFRDALLMILLLASGFFGWLDQSVRTFLSAEGGGNPVSEGLLYFALLAAGSYVLNLPFSVYQTFRIEEKYGFNKTTVKTFILDQFRGMLAGALIGGTVLALLILYLSWDFEYSWLLAAGTVISIMIFMNFFYSDLILPLFNKLEPLKDESLNKKMTELSEKAGFPVSGIYIMDGSKRSTKANAFFSGFGRRKKIVLFDTLLEKYGQNEILAVLAHEIGHYKKNHIIKNIITGSLHTVILIWLLFYFVRSPGLSQALGAPGAGISTGLTAFMFLYSPVSMALGVVLSWFSRKYEFEADAFAKEYADGHSLSSALKKMSVDHMSNLHPHPYYVFFHYSHPPVLHRMERLLN